MSEQGVTSEWTDLIAAMREAMAQRVSPREPSTQTLARRWMDLLRRTAMEAPDRLHHYDGTQLRIPGFQPQSGVDRDLFDYMSAALWAKHLSADEAGRLRTDGPNQREWPIVLDALRDQMNCGTSVTSPTVQQLVRRWESGLDEITAGDAELRRKWLTAIRSDPTLLSGSGAEPRLQHYLSRAYLAKPDQAA